MKISSFAGIVVCSMAFLFAVSFSLDAKHHHHKHHGHHHHKNHSHHHKHHGHHHHKHHNHQHTGFVSLNMAPSYTVSPLVIVQKPVIYPTTSYVVYQQPVYDYYLAYSFYWVR